MTTCYCYFSPIQFCCSYDAREGKSFGHGHRWADENVLGRRAYFLPTRSAAHTGSYNRGQRSVDDSRHVAEANHTKFYRKRIPKLGNDLNNDLFDTKLTRKVERKTYSSEWKDRGIYSEDKVLQTKPRYEKESTTYISRDPPSERSWHIMEGSEADFLEPTITEENSYQSEQMYDDVFSQTRRAREATDSEPALSLVPVAQEDHGLYKCRMDYWESPTSMSFTGLYVASRCFGSIDYLTICRPFIAKNNN